MRLGQMTNVDGKDAHNRDVVPIPRPLSPSGPFSIISSKCSGSSSPVSSAMLFSHLFGPAGDRPGIARVAVNPSFMKQIFAI
jgi:hypothetical protein